MPHAFVVAEDLGLQLRRRSAVPQNVRDLVCSHKCATALGPRDVLERGRAGGRDVLEEVGGGGIRTEEGVVCDPKPWVPQNGPTGI